MPNGLLMEEISSGLEHHTYIPYGNPELGVANQVALYGIPQTLEELCEQAQLANFVQYRALVEGFSMHMWTDHTGFLIWKTQNPWMGLRGQLYDWSFSPLASLFAVRLACQPLHVFLCPRDGGSLLVTNITGSCYVGRLVVTVCDLAGREQELLDEVVEISSSSSQVLKQLPLIRLPPREVFFLSMSMVAFDCKSKQARRMKEKMSARNGEETRVDNLGGEDEDEDEDRISAVISRNFYWLTLEHLDGGVYQDEFIALGLWRKENRVLLDAKAIGYVSATGGEDKQTAPCRFFDLRTRREEEEEEEGKISYTLLVKISNFSSPASVAMFLQLRVNGVASPPPVLYEDNFFSLLPGEQRLLKIDWAGDAGSVGGGRSKHASSSSRCSAPLPSSLRSSLSSLSSSSSSRHFDRVWGDMDVPSTSSPLSVGLELMGYNVEPLQVPIKWSNL
mmetsp:Transcript_48397/g.151745  ORF Transcript_48397/g.151745 Transcript_48397/m.151745 type:complete len:448 (-) Transcript_48397:510-1853(-)